MLDPNLIYNNLNEISEKLSKKGYSLNSEEFKNLYESRKNTIKEVEALKEEQNIFTKKISKEKRKPTNEELISIKKLIEKIKKFDDIRKEVELNLKKILLDIPNIFDDEIPIGIDEKEMSIQKMVIKKFFPLLYVMKKVLLEQVTYPSLKKTYLKSKGRNFF